MFIEVPIVLAGMKSPILLLNEEERRGLRWLRFSDFARFEVFVNELFASIHSLWVDRICFRYLGDKGIFKINGMVKRLSRRELSILWFIKHLSVLGILWWEFLFDLLSSLSKKSGEGEFSDKRMVGSLDLYSMLSLFSLLTECDSIAEFLSLTCS